MQNIEDSLLEDSDEFDDDIIFSPHVESNANNTRNIVIEERN
tara:strand:- start:892 stop:1017 length:126 start_codon:yes stop_codon:yes gene_type:complete